MVQLPPTWLTWKSFSHQHNFHHTPYIIVKSISMSKLVESLTSHTLSWQVDIPRRWKYCLVLMEVIFRDDKDNVRIWLKGFWQTCSIRTIFFTCSDCPYSQQTLFYVNSFFYFHLLATSIESSCEVCPSLLSLLSFGKSLLSILPKSKVSLSTSRLVSWVYREGWSDQISWSTLSSLLSPSAHKIISLRITRWVWYFYIFHHLQQGKPLLQVQPI